MKSARRLGILGTGVELSRDRVVIRLPHPRLFRLVARSVLLAVAFLSFNWLNAMIPRVNPGASGDEESFLPTLLGDLRDRDLIRTGDRAVFVGEPGSGLPSLLQNGIDSVSGELAVPDHTLDFALVAGEHGVGFGFIDRALKVGGVAAVRLGSDPSELFRLPASYRMVYARRFGSTLVVAMKKVAGGVEDDAPELQTLPQRRLLSVPESKKEALNGLEDVVLEPPARGRLRGRRTRYLPDLMGDSLDGYPRRVFVDVGPPERVGSAEWFGRHYPRRHRDFEIIRVDVLSSAAAAGDGGMPEWLARNVKEEEYVVVKAEAEVVEEMVRGRALGLVDELFLECSNQWQKGRKGLKSRRAYWECLALYGKLRDEGVAVHQWWG